MNNKLIINRIPSSKTEQKEMANAFISKVIDGGINPIDAVVQMKSISETVNTFLKDENIKDAVIQECEKYGKGESPGYLGAVIQIKELVLHMIFPFAMILYIIVLLNRGKK